MLRRKAPITTKQRSNTQNAHTLNRRQVLQSVPLLAMAPAALAQDRSPVAVRKIHSFDIKVSDLARSLKFYQDLFGAPIQSRRNGSVYLRVGDGPHFFSISQASPVEVLGFSHIGLSVEDFDADLVRSQLAAAGVSPTAAPGPDESGLDLASRSWVAGASSSSEVYFADIEGLVYQLTGENFCGGSGPLGDRCSDLEFPDSEGMFRLIDYSHFTNFVANRGRANTFYTSTFGKRFQAYQGPASPVIGVGDGIQFLMYVGGDAQGAPTQPARIDHVCFSVETFNVDRILAQLTDYGLTAREDPANTRPLMHWISMRMPNRGGAPQGTPELYFTDPDGIRIQLQDPSYCGGTGYLGDSCPPLV